MFSFSTLSILAFGPIAAVLAIPAPISSQASALATKNLQARNIAMPANVIQGTLGGFNGDGALADAWNAANNWTGPASWDVDFCTCDNASPALEWLITIPNDNKYDTGGCGAGFLDNLRGRCGVITNWQCQMVGAQGTTAALYFATTAACTLSDATDVIATASSNGIPSMQCAYADEEGGDVGRDMPFGGDGSDDPSLGAGDVAPEGDA